MLYILCFVNGAILTALCGLEVQRYLASKTPKIEPESPDTRMIKQWENFMNYDGTERGQRSIGD